MFHLLGAALPVTSAGVADDPIRAYLPLFPVGSEQVYADEFREAALARGRPEVARAIDGAARTLQRRKVVRDLRNLLIPGRARRVLARTDLLPWGRGPVPESW
jgi:hypothetical protein